MSSVYETVLDRIEAFPLLYKSRTEVLLDILVVGNSSWKWHQGEAVWDCSTEIKHTVDQYMAAAYDSMMSMLPLLSGVPESAIDIVLQRVRERFIIAQEMAPFTAQLVDLKVKSPYKSTTFPHSLFANTPDFVTADWKNAVGEVHLVLDAEGHLN